MEETNAIRVGARRRRVIIILAACVLMGIGVVAFWPGEREPVYNGKKLSEWLQLYGSTGISVEQREQAKVAVRQIGTNALPWLVKWIQCDRRDLPQWKTRLAVAACK